MNIVFKYTRTYYFNGKLTIEELTITSTELVSTHNTQPTYDDFINLIIRWNQQGTRYIYSPLGRFFA